MYSSPAHPTPRLYQIEGVSRLLGFRRDAILADEPGLGKALVNGTRVATPTGFMPIEDLKVGDRVLGTSGFSCKVMGVYPQDRKQCATVTFSDGARIRCSLDHLWSVQTKRDRMLSRNGRVMTTGEMARASVRMADGRSRFYVSTCLPVYYEGCLSRVMPAYTLGALLANGGMTGSSVLLTTADEEVRARVLGELPKEMKISYRDELTSSLSMKKGGSRNPYRTELERMGLLCLSVDKHIPMEYLFADDRLSLLHGLMDGDGYCSIDGTVQYNTSSCALADDVRLLLESFGCVVRTTMKKAGYRDEFGTYKECRMHYTLTVNCPRGFRPFSLKRKVDRLSMDREYLPVRGITGIDPIGPLECTCIAVDSPDHLFLTEHYIPTHNTISAALYLNVLKPSRVLVVCPASLRLNWRGELDRWLDYMPEELSICSYEQIVRGSAINLFPEVIIFDEAHYLKNPDAMRTKVCLRISAKRRLFLTGTPVVNRPMDLFPILSSMGLKLSRQEFGKKFCDGHLEVVPVSDAVYSALLKRGRVHGIYYNPAYKCRVRNVWNFAGHSNEEELNKELRERCMVRRTKSDVLADLPAKTRQILVLDASSGESASYRSMAAAAKTVEDFKVLFTSLAKERLELAKKKEARVVSVLYDILEEEDKVVVFAWHREVIEALANDLVDFNPVILYGGMSDKAKNDAVEAFQKGNSRVFIGQISAAGVGLTLTAARTCVFAEEDWVPGNITQAEDRIHRIGQSLPCRVLHITFKNSIDERMIRALVEKQETIDKVVK